jgi:hypothetical protein
MPLDVQIRVQVGQHLMNPTSSKFRQRLVGRCAAKWMRELGRWGEGDKSLFDSLVQIAGLQAELGEGAMDEKWLATGSGDYAKRVAGSRWQFGDLRAEADRASIAQWQRIWKWIHTCELRGSQLRSELMHHHWVAARSDL